MANPQATMATALSCSLTIICIFLKTLQIIHELNLDCPNMWVQTCGYKHVGTNMWVQA